METKNCLVAFIDILGFKEIIQNENSKDLTNIVETLSRSIRFKRGSERYGNSPEVDVIGFSDSVLLSIEHLEGDRFDEKVVHMLKICSEIQSSLLKKGILSRGSITFGEHSVFKAENITYFPSKAFIRAAILEKEIAIYPRVVIDDELLVCIDEGTRRRYLIKDIHEVHFLNYLDKFDSEQKLDLERLIVGRMLKYFGLKNKGVHEKYIWLENYYRWSFSGSINYFSRI